MPAGTDHSDLKNLKGCQIEPEPELFRAVPRDKTRKNWFKL